MFSEARSKTKQEVYDKAMVDVHLVEDVCVVGRECVYSRMCVRSIMVQVSLELDL